jgi:hypothetical protein
VRVSLPVLLTLLLVACGDTQPTVPTERPKPGSFRAVEVRAQAEVAAGSGFADQTGGGVFATASGEAVRLRLDGTRAALENHPGNAAPPGAVRAAFRLGPRTALVEAANGLYLADAGWLIAPPWREALGPGLVATAQAADGAVWLAHASGLYRLVNGALSALKVEGQALEGITALAAAPAEDGAPGVWFLRGGVLSVAVATGPGVYQVRTATPPLEEGETLVTLAALGPGKEAAGEAWVLTSERLLRRASEGWRRVEFSQRPVQLLASGRFLWVKSGDALVLLDADANAWATASGVDTREFRFLAADESGCAWVQLGAETVAVSRAPAPRVSGLHQGMQVVEDGLVLRAVLPPGPPPVSVAFELAGTRIPVEGPEYSMGGVEVDGALKAYSFAGMEPGRYTLDVVALLQDGGEARRSVPFDYQPLSTVVLGWEQDVRPLFEARCAKCHTTGPGRPLASYALWKENVALITAAVRDQRMPADGPLNPQQIALLQRWAASGAKP